VVLLSGEAGIGKSRLTAALLERLTAEPHARLRYFCSPPLSDHQPNGVNGPRNLLTLGRAIFPTWRGRRSAV
jgi:MoxR-like ATPase